MNGQSEMNPVVTAKFLAIAIAFWGHTPACGTPRVIDVDMAQARASGIAEIGFARPSDCTIGIDDVYIRETTFGIVPSVECTLMVHEVGHLILGPVFGATNPSDPWHSSDPTSVMHASPSMPKQCYPSQLRVTRKIRHRVKHHQHKKS